MNVPNKLIIVLQKVRLGNPENDPVGVDNISKI
jgi:hypothetical protein